MIGQKIHQYEFAENLGAGGMGVVYKAYDTVLKRPVAIKRLHPATAADPERRKRFLKEAQNAAGINHDGVAAIYDILDEGGELFLVMEYVEGTTLRELEPDGFGIDEFRSVAVQCAEALKAAHEHGIIHRDLKPGNIMLTSSRKVKLLDFGLAQHVATPEGTTGENTDATEPGRIAGTLAYIAPEVLMGRPADQRSDIFALGVVFYEILAGKHPFLDVTAPATVHRILGASLAPLSQVNPRVPAELELVVRKMLEKEPAARYSSADELLSALREGERLRWPVKSLGIAAALAACVVLAIATPWIRACIDSLLRYKTLPGNPSVAVLPMAVEAGLSEYGPFVRGMTEVLGQRLSLLSAQRSFSVVPCSLARARGIAEVDGIEKHLGASLALSGRLAEQGAGVRVDLSLIEGKGGRVLRRGGFAGSMSDPMTLDFLLVEKSGELLGVKLDPRERRELADYGTKDPVSYQRYLQGLGQLLYSRESGHQQAAIESLREAESLDPGLTRVQEAIGAAHLSLFEESGNADHLQAALSRCLAASQKHADLAGPQRCLGEVYLKMGALDESIAHYERARFLNPADLNLPDELGAAYLAAGRVDDAERTYQEIVRRKPDYWRGHSTLGAFYFGQSRFPDAEREFKKVTVLAPQYYRGFSSLCGVYGEMFQWEDMQRACEQSLAIREQGAPYTNLATAWFFQRRYPEAAQVARRALIFLEKSDPGSRSYVDYGNLAEILHWSPGERESAVAPCRKAIEGAGDFLRRNPRDAATLGRVALYHAMLGEGDPALRYLKLALETGPDNPETLYKAAVIHMCLGQSKKALEFLQTAVQKGVKPEKIRLHPVFKDLSADPGFKSLIGGD